MIVFFSSPTPKLAVSLDNAVATIAVDNPAKRNAFDLEMWKALPPIMRALDDDERVRVVVLRGAGDNAFTAGADISEFGTLRADAEGGRLYEAANEAAFWAVAQCAKPVIAMIRGFCLGGGRPRPLLRPAHRGRGRGLRHSGRAARRRLPGERHEDRHRRRGGAGSERPVLHRPAHRRKEATRLGLVQRVVSVAALEDAALSLAGEIARNAPLTIRAAKAAIDHSMGVNRPGADPVALADLCFESDDAVEGRRAFMEKRPPVFKGS